MSQEYFTTKSTAIKLGNKTFGIVYSDEFRKVITGSKHLLRRPPAICIDKGALERAEAAGAKKIKITDDETGIIYRCTVDHLKRAAVVINRGFGEQWALVLDSWTVQRPGQPLQLSLFGVES
jgi:hypothetical protein